MQKSGAASDQRRRVWACGRYAPGDVPDFIVKQIQVRSIFGDHRSETVTCSVTYIWCCIVCRKKSLLVFTRYSMNIWNCDMVCCAYVFVSNCLGEWGYVSTKNWSHHYRPTWPHWEGPSRLKSTYDLTRRSTHFYTHYCEDEVGPSPEIRSMYKSVRSDNIPRSWWYFWHVLTATNSKSLDTASPYNN